MLVDIDLIKKHCRADDFTEDDELLTFYGKAATDYVIQATRRTAAELQAMGDGGNAYPLPLQQAALLIIAHWYNQREAVAPGGMQEVPYAAQALIRPYQKLTDYAGRTTTNTD